MTHPYEPRWRAERSYRPVATNNPTPVTWICAALFAFTLFVAFVLPIAHHFSGAAESVVAGPSNPTGGRQ
jgi:hypothetical protein